MSMALNGPPWLRVWIWRCWWSLIQALVNQSIFTIAKKKKLFMRQLRGHAQSQHAEHTKLQRAFWIWVFVSRDQNFLDILRLLHGAIAPRSLPNGSAQAREKAWTEERVSPTGQVGSKETPGLLYIWHGPATLSIADNIPAAQVSRVPACLNSEHS